LSSSFHTVISSQPFGPVQFPNPLQAPGVAFDLYNIHQVIFEAMVQIEEIITIMFSTGSTFFGWVICWTDITY